VDYALAFSALLMGLAASPHCIAMCGAACAGVAGRYGGGRPQRALLAFHAGRLAGYAAGGALVAAGVAALGMLSELSPVLRPLWTLLHAAAFTLGLWLAWKGRQPAWMENLGRGTSRVLAVAPGGGQPVAMPRRHGRPLRAGAVGTLWLAWPCGLLHSALVLAGLGNSGLAGAMIMAAFAVGSSIGLWAGPALAWRLLGARAASDSRAATWAIRMAGAALAAASAWAIGHEPIGQFVAYCLS
jgi:sulfite exporter TauE/SafE